MTPEQRAEAKRYGRVELVCGLIDKALDLLYLAVVAVAAAGPLDHWLQQASWLRSCWSLRLAALFLIVTAAHVFVSFPLSFYAGYVVEKRFALSTLTLGGWLWRYAKRMGLATALGAAMVLGLYWLIWTTHGWWWLAAAAAFLVRQHPLRSTLAGGDPAALLQDRKARRPGTGRADRPAGRRDGPVDRGRLSHGPERRDGEGQRHAGRPGTHPPRVAGRYAAGQLHAR